MSVSAPEEVVTKAYVREVELTPFGFTGKLALITLDNQSARQSGVNHQSGGVI